MSNIFTDFYNRYSPVAALSRGDYWGAVKRMTPLQYVEDISGYTQYRNTQASTQAQVNYENSLKRGYQRQLDDWYRNVGRYGRTIRYPELSFPGYINRSDTSIARNMFDYDSAGANFYGNLPYRSAGLYGIASRVSHYL